MTTKPYHEMNRQERERAASDALNNLRADYYTDVTDTADSIRESVQEAFDSGKRGEELRECLLTAMHETIDGCSRVIYTFQAQLGLLMSDNAGAYVDNFGTDGVAIDGDLNWSALMFSALEQDVFEHWDAHNLDVNEPESWFAETA